MTGSDDHTTPDPLLALICQETGRVTVSEAHAWVARGWISIRSDDVSARAAAAARLALIQSLRDDMGVEDTSLDLVLDLIDKLRLEAEKHACLDAALDLAPSAPPETVRATAARLFRDRMGDRR